MKILAFYPNHLKFLTKLLHLLSNHNIVGTLTEGPITSSPFTQTFDDLAYHEDKKFHCQVFLSVKL